MMTIKSILIRSLSLLLAISMSYAANAQSLSINEISNDWAVANFKLKEKAQLEAFETLVGNAETLVAAIQAGTSDESKVEAIIWSGVAKASYAGVKGGLGALGLAKAAKKELEQAEKIDRTALSGSALTTLGSLYANVPGWPIGFGSEKKAQKYFEEGLSIDPDGIDSNFFYGTFLLNQKKYAKANEALLRAQQAAPRSNQQLADESRQKEIKAILDDIAAKLAK